MFRRNITHELLEALADSPVLFLRGAPEELRDRLFALDPL
jgi:hypothetical protein